MSWQDELLPASFRGVPFAVRSVAIKPGRQTAPHSYPYREKDPVWVEDVGAGPRPFSFTGFLVEGDRFCLGLGVFLQRDLMVAACQTKGSGLLVHPSLGARTVSLVGGCEMVERADMGGAIELTFTVMETAEGPVYPAGQTSTADDTKKVADAADKKSSESFGDSVVGAVKSGAEAVGKAAETVSGWVAQAETVVQTATRYVGAVAGVAGIVGRYAGGSRVLPQGVTATASSLLAGATAARTAVSVAGSAASSLASLL